MNSNLCFNIFFFVLFCVNAASQAGVFVRLHRFDEWDNRFFGISDKEAEVVDPQQHFVLESVHMALEDAGIPKEKIAGSNTGVYIGR